MLIGIFYQVDIKNIF